METQSLDELQEIRAEVSHESFKKRSFQRKIEDLLVNITDEDLDQINEIREQIKKSTEQIELVCEKTQMLSWKLLNPNELQLEIVNEIIVLGRSVVEPSSIAVESLRPLWCNGVVSNEINEFTEVVDHWSEVLDDIEAAFFSLPVDSNFMHSKSELELL